MTCTRSISNRAGPPSAALIGLVVSGCVFGSQQPEYQPDYNHQAEYKVSCNISDDCRVQFIDQSGVLRASDITGEWTYVLGINPGGRMWVRASGGGCPPRPLRVEIWLDGRQVAEDLVRPTHRSRCDWLFSETDFVVP